MIRTGTDSPGGAEAVVLVHGLWVSGFSMALMQRRIARCGYRVLRFSYPSMRCTLTENSERLSAYCGAIECDVLHLVGHSLGGLVALHAAARERIPKLGRIVVAGTPFGKSFSAQRLARLPGGRAMLGKCACEWLRYGQWPDLGAREIGVIAGDLSFGLGRVLAPNLPAPNDGVVQTDETPVPGMRDHIVMHVSHTAMLLAPSVVREVCAFLKNGRFTARDAAVPDMQRSDPCTTNPKS